MNARGLDVPSGRHICMLYGNDDERLHEIVRFLSAGQRQRHKLLYIADSESADPVRRQLEAAGLDPGTEVRTTIESYHPDGRFDPDAMLGSLEGFCATAIRDGFRGCRCTGEMTWATRNIPGAERLIEYEIKLTDVIERNPFSGICQYDVRRFDGRTILAVLEVHPYLLLRGHVLQNPNYVRDPSHASRQASSDARPLQ